MKTQLWQAKIRKLHCLFYPFSVPLKWSFNLFCDWGIVEFLFNLSFLQLCSRNFFDFLIFIGWLLLFGGSVCFNFSFFKHFYPNSKWFPLFSHTNFGYLNYLMHVCILYINCSLQFSRLFSEFFLNLLFDNFKSSVDNKYTKMDYLYFDIFYAKPNAFTEQRRHLIHTYHISQ